MDFDKTYLTLQPGCSYSRGVKSYFELLQSLNKTMDVSSRQLAAARQILVSPLAGQIRYDAERGEEFWADRLQTADNTRDALLISVGHVAIDVIEEPMLVLVSDDDNEAVAA